MKARDFYNATRLTVDQVGQCNAWELPSIPQRISLEHKTVLPIDFENNNRELQRQLEESKKIGYEEGMKLGKQDGYNAGLGTIKEKAKIFDSLLRAFDIGIKGVDHIFEHQILNFAVAIAKAVIRHELSTNSQLIEKVVKEALSCLPKNATGIRLHMHSDDIDMLKETLDGGLLSSLKNISFINDNQLTRGGCIIEAENSYLDATIEARLQNILKEVNSDPHDATNT